MKKLFIYIILANLILAINIDTIKFNYREKQYYWGLTEKIPNFVPNITLVLSGGGARGLAHIGLLQAFEENNIRIDNIVGTSIGSIVGGLYSIGYKPCEIRKIFVDAPWEDLLSITKETKREDLFLDQKLNDDRALLTLKLKGFDIILPTSLNSGQKFSNFLNEAVLNAPINSCEDFDKLLYNYRAVATNLKNGQKVVFSSGLLSQVMRASSNISFLFEPMSIDTLLLVDGGLVSNIPVSVAKEFKSDVIIASNTTSRLNNENLLDKVLYVADQTISIPINIISQEELKNADLEIKHDIENINFVEFKNFDSIINSGYKKGLQYVEEIQKLTAKSIKNKIRNKVYPNPEIIIKSDYAKLIDYSKYKDTIDNYQLISIAKNIYDNHKIVKDISIIIDSTKNKYTITFNILEYPKINHIEINNLPVDIPKIELQQITNKFYGIYANPRIIVDSIISLNRYFRDLSYVLLDVSSVKLENDKLVLNISNGFINKIRILGNYKTKAYIIKRELTIDENKLLTLKDIKTSLRNINSTQLFTNISFKIEQQDDQNILFVNVKEKITSLIRMGFKIDEEYGTLGLLDIRDENLFGDNLELGLNLEGGKGLIKLNLDQKTSRIFNSYINYKLQFFYNLQLKNVYQQKGIINRFTYIGKYEQSDYGSSLAFGYQIKKLGNFIIETRYQQSRLVGIEGLSVNKTLDKILAHKISLVFDSKDNTVFTTKGVYNNFYYETASKKLGGNVGYSKLYFEHQSYFNYFHNSVISPKIIFGFGDNALPLSQYFNLGGSKSFIGFRQYQFVGRQIFQFSFSHASKLPFRILFDSYLKFRYDMGNIWEQKKDISIKDMKHALGVFLTLDSPIGPIEISYGRSLIINDIKKITKYNFSRPFLNLNIGI